MHRSKRRILGQRLGRSLVVVGAIVIVGALAPMSAGAAPGGGKGGNNGTVKIDGGDADSGHSNDPHVGCAFSVQWWGFDEGEQTADVEFAAQSPTSGGVLLDDSFSFEGSGSADNLDASRAYDLTNALQNLAPHHKQGWHVKVTIETTSSNGSQTKHKTFWVQGCFDPTIEATACTGDGGSPGITLTVTNNDVTQDFTVDQDGTSFEVEIEAGATEVFHLPQPGTDSTITVTSTSNDQVSATTTVSAQECAAEPNPTASITLDKVIAGNAAPQNDPSFGFRVTCDDPNATFPMGAEGAEFTIRASDPATTIAEHVGVGTSCTVTETATNSATSTSFSVDGGVPVTGTSVQVTPASASAVAVIATNTFTQDVSDTTEPPTTEPPTTETLATETVAPAGTQVLGTELARTGINTWLWTIVGSSLVLGGLLLVELSKRSFATAPGTN